MGGEQADSGSYQQGDVVAVQSGIECAVTVPDVAVAELAMVTREASPMAPPI
jgi:hypothetical protein